MNKIITILLLFFSLYLNANDGFPEVEKKERQVLLNSNHNHNSTTLIQVKEPKQEKSNWEVFYEVLKDWSGTLLAIGGFLTGYVLIRRKLIESHVSKILIDLQEANKKLLKEVTELIDEYTNKTYTIEFVNKEELLAIESSIKKLFKISQDASSDSQTTLFYLKITIQQTIKNLERIEVDYPELTKKKFPTVITTKDMYGLILRTLERVTFLLSQVVQVPDSIRTEKKQWFDDKIQPYVTNAEFTKYKSLKQGLDYDPDSALYLLFYSDILTKSNTLFMRSAFQIYESTAAVSKLLYAEDIYAPLSISATYEDSGDKEVQTLYLVGFRYYETWLNGGGKEQLVKLVYSNPSDYILFTDSIDIKKLKTRYHDSFNKNSTFEMNQVKSITHSNFETIEIQFNRDYLKNLFPRNKKAIKKTFPKKHAFIRIKSIEFLKKLRIMNQ